jgi:alanine dehydrogenase
MKIGCPKEIKPQEFRVGLTPDAIREAVAHGHSLYIEVLNIKTVAMATVFILRPTQVQVLALQMPIMSRLGPRFLLPPKRFSPSPK